ncbi:hypothetical protein P775_17180 [Puniceibacterium antarcticum]|uniref:STAS/SEC14 domain-containing protein n=1 Tax=Puniceibacterium antarcticum TaxID=1206336 RepID=A0A2G8RBR1_9RHOB|nr:STAS/SEC14 domain-containing protein [Puniceibacterium antarcticum]PIL18989.1 hypothetical protein P775_17180 [Puniceibacterium antarcticum]
MIEMMSIPEDGMLGFRVKGTVTEADYERILIPALESALCEHDRLRLLVRIENSYHHSSLRALFVDAKMGLTYWNKFDRVAVIVTRGALNRIMPVLIPCPVMVFPLSEQEAAMSWLCEPQENSAEQGVLSLPDADLPDVQSYEDDLKIFFCADDQDHHLPELVDLRNAVSGRNPNKRRAARQRVQVCPS